MIDDKPRAVTPARQVAPVVVFPLLVLLSTTTCSSVDAFSPCHIAITTNHNVARLSFSATNMVKRTQRRTPDQRKNAEIDGFRECAASNLNDDDEYDQSRSTGITSDLHLRSRKQVLERVFGSVVISAAGVLTASSLSPSMPPAQAFDRSFPMELTDVDDDNSVIMLGGGRRTNSQQRKRQAEQKKTIEKENLVNFNVKNDLAPSLVWGGALWLLSGSRSNPLATPLANLIYGKDSDEPWLKDRNAGLFAAPPPVFLVVLGFVFLGLGTLLQLLVLQLSEGDSGVCAQLAGVALINGVFFEIGRIASGDKRMTRDELDRALELKREFEEFADKRLVAGGNCHRSDIVKAFRRFHAKYRQADSDDFPLADLEIEKLLRAWNQINNKGQAEMTQTGFYYGLSINKDADVFV